MSDSAEGLTPESCEPSCSGAEEFVEWFGPLTTRLIWETESPREVLTAAGFVVHGWQELDRPGPAWLGVVQDPDGMWRAVTTGDCSLGSADLYWYHRLHRWTLLQHLLRQIPDTADTAPALVKCLAAAHPHPNPDYWLEGEAMALVLSLFSPEQREAEEGLLSLTQPDVLAALREVSSAGR